MSKRGSYGGGKSSLGYLFGSDEQPTAPPPSRPVNLPPYGVDSVSTTLEKPPDDNRSPNEKQQEQQQPSNNYHRAKGQNLGNFITDRPSTRVNSVPGGDSSLGYLFGDK